MLYLDRTMLLNALHFRAKKKINKSCHRYYKTNIKTTYSPVLVVTTDFVSTRVVNCDIYQTQ